MQLTNPDPSKGPHRTSETCSSAMCHPRQYDLKVAKSHWLDRPLRTSTTADDEMALKV
jgi:hypothetical protein